MSEYKFNYDYSKTLWMKMFLATPDFQNKRSNVFINFETALEIIKTVDFITQGITKIIYLVGWQGLGHDDCYPEMDKVNDFLKGRTWDLPSPLFDTDEGSPRLVKYINMYPPEAPEEFQTE